MNDKANKKQSPATKGGELSTLEWLRDYGDRQFNDGMNALHVEILNMHEKWKNEAMDDPEIKQELNSKGVLKGGKEFTDRVMGNSEDANKFREMVNETGIGNNPLFLKFCIRAGKLLDTKTVRRGRRAHAV